ncbi:hypothetical protein [Georgenia alba]|uniref:Uncharacterized protein n=1 Tax=Georgenia alba TaxID=2233858 RepID=A0ABW2Q5J9_9MICO
MSTGLDEQRVTLGDLFPERGTAPPNGAPTPQDRHERRRELAHLLKDLAPAALVLLGVLLWAVGLEPVDPDTLDGYGLITKLSPVCLTGIVLVGAAGAWELFGQRRTIVLALATIGLWLSVSATQPLVYGPARLPWGWIHAGFSEHIGMTGDVIHNFDIRFSWPAMFTVTQMWAEAAGLERVDRMIELAPVAFTGIAALGVGALAQAVAGPGRVAWLAVWLFLAASWTEQDYFSPQALTYCLYVAGLAIMVSDLTSPGPATGGRILPWRRSVPPTTPGTRIRAHVLLLLLAVALAPTHQLSPFVLAGMALVLLLFGRLSSAWLPIMLLSAPTVWFFLGARETWVNELEKIVGGIGDFGGSLNAGVTDRVSGDLGHQVITSGRIGVFLLVGLIAFVGWLVLRRAAHRTWALPVLAGSTFLIAAVQPYGGEIFMRCYLFSLPWLAIGIGYALEALRSRAVLARVVSAVLVGALAVSCLALRGGNDAWLTFTDGDLAVMDVAYGQAREGETIVVLRWSTPLQMAAAADVPQRGMDELDSEERPCVTEEQMVACLEQDEVEYVVITPQQDREGVILDGMEPGWTGQVADGLLAHGYRVVYEHDGRLLLAREDREAGP